MTEQPVTTAELPRLAEWLKGGVADPVCPNCGWYLGLRIPDQYSLDKRNVWWCAKCGEDYDAGR